MNGIGITALCVAVEELQRAREQALRNCIANLEIALKQSQEHNANLIRHNAILQELAANKTAYADQLRQALNRQRVGNPELKVPENLVRDMMDELHSIKLSRGKECCNGCRYLVEETLTRGDYCRAFGWRNLDSNWNGVRKPTVCNGPYPPRTEEQS